MPDAPLVHRSYSSPFTTVPQSSHRQRRPRPPASTRRRILIQPPGFRRRRRKSVRPDPDPRVRPHHDGVQGVHPGRAYGDRPDWNSRRFGPQPAPRPPAGPRPGPPQQGSNPTRHPCSRLPSLCPLCSCVFGGSHPGPAWHRVLPVITRGVVVICYHPDSRIGGWEGCGARGVTTRARPSQPIAVEKESLDERMVRAQGFEPWTPSV